MRRFILPALVLCLIGSSALGATATQLSQYGITWTFDRPCEYGQFANGDYWVVGPVTITSINPPSTESDGRTMNGSMINPGLGMTQGYDSAMYGTYGPAYSAARNVALDVSPGNPLVVPNGSSLISTISHPTAGERPQLTDAAVLTVLASAPPAGSFRPPYTGPDKAVRYNVSDLDYSRLPRLTAPASAPSLSSTAGGFARVWPDHYGSWTGRYFHPSNNMPDYGRDIAMRIGNGLLVLLLDYTDQEKETLLVRMTQLGIDLYGVFQAGCTWEDLGGHMHGRKMPILLAGLVLGDEGMLAVGQLPLRFQEDRQTWIVRQSDVGRPLYHDDGRPREEYIQEDVGLPEWGEQHTKQPSRDGRNWNAYYRRNVGHSILAHVLTANILGLRDAWNWEPLFLYIDRYWTIETTVTGTDAISQFHKDMWVLHRDAVLDLPVAMPRFGPKGGSFNGSVEVTIGCATDGATIYYTDDGSMPTTSSAVYTGPITLTATATLRALAVRGGMDDSPVASAAFTVSQNQAPRADAGPAQHLIDSDDDGAEPVTLDGTGSRDADGAIVSYVWTLGGDALAAGATPTVTLPVGTHAIDLAVTDEEGVTAGDTVVIAVHPAGGPTGIARIAFDAVSSTSDTGGTVLSWSHTIGGGDNRLLVVTVGARDGTATDLAISAVTYDGVAMTAAPGGLKRQGSGTRAQTAIFYMLDADLPPAGSYPVEVTYAGSVDRRSGGAISLANVDQQGPEAVATNGVTAAAITSSITTATDGAWVVDVVCINTGSGSAWTATGEAMVRRWNQCVSGGGHTAAGATTPAPIAGETILSWQVNTSGNQVAHSMAAFAPALVNLAPAAHAGPDQTVIDTDGSGDEAVTLDGSASFDIDGTIVSHAWTSAGEPIAAGASPTVTLAAGTHPIELTVADEQGATDTDTVVITVAADGAPDIDLLAAAIRSGQNDPRFDLNSDGAVDAADLAVLVRDVLGTELGDANLDGRVNLDDFVILKTHFGRPGGWADGDFDASGAIDLDDFVILKTGFGFGG